MKMKSYKGTCHCKQVTFEFQSEDILQGIYKCNCTLCRKKSILMKPEHNSQFKIISGGENLLSYKWNKNIAEHFFCKFCGVYTHHKRRRYPDQIVVNIACLDDVILPNNLEIGQADGASHD